ncbi:MAG TPA: HWE histidine kinase domain-containing protein [Caulobacteraceae bacterium]
MEDGAPAIPADHEAARLGALHELRVLDTAPEPCFDRIARTAATLMKAPRAAVLFIDRDRIWHKARVGIPDPVYPRDGTLADLMVESAEVTLSADISRDPRFAGRLNALALVDVKFYGCAPLIMPGGEVVGLLVVGDTNAHSDITDDHRQALADLAALAVDELVRRLGERRAEEQRRYDDARVELALETAGLGEFEWNLGSDRIHMNPRVRELTGAPSDHVPGDGGQISYRFVHPDDAERVKREVEEQLQATGRYLVEYRMVRPSDNRVRWMRGAGRLVNGPDGAPRLIGVLQDRTDRQLDEEHREALLAELDHRVKNVLAAVQSLAAHSARKTTSLDSFLKTFAGRLKAMASAHELLTATRWRGAAIGDIAAAELGGLAPGQARWEGPEIVLTPRAANALALALHELAINAVKFGALSSDAGKVQVCWKARPDGGFVLEWSEQDGPPVSPPTRQGFGSTLLEQVTVRELGGPVKVDFRREGVRARIEGDVGALAGHADPETAAVGLARQAAVGASVGEPQKPAGSVRGLRILIVEDSVLLALELEAGLVEAGAEVVAVAVDLDEAVEALRQPFDAAVLDVNLNGRLVTPLAETLQDRKVPFVFATGYGETGAPDGFEAPIVRKPYNVHQIVNALVEATGPKA